MTAYAIISGGKVANIALADEAFAQERGWVPAVGAAIGYLWDGQAFSKPAAVVVVPDSISPRQFRQSLTHFGFRANVEAAIAASDQDTKDWYEFATSFERTHPKVVSMAQALGYTTSQIDAVWTYGAAL